MKKIIRNVLLICLLIFLIFAAIIYYDKYAFIFKNPIKIKKFILSYGKYSIGVYLALQIIQVVIFFIPGEIVQIAGGYIYGTLLGSLLSLIGITVGGAVVFLLSNKLGKPFVKRIVSEKDMVHIKKILEYDKAKYIVFLLYLIPGIPKDILGYVCGVSEVTFKDYMIYSTAGRMPCIFISAYFGTKLVTGEIGKIVIIAVIMTALFILGVFKGEKIIKGILSKF